MVTGASNIDTVVQSEMPAQYKDIHNLRILPKLQLHLQSPEYDP